MSYIIFYKLILHVNPNQVDTYLLEDNKGAGVKD